jgi:hypothetical protein
LTFHIKKGCIPEDQEYQRFLAKFNDYEAAKKGSGDATPKAINASGGAVQ